MPYSGGGNSGAGAPKRYFTVTSSASVTVSTSLAAPSNLPALTLSAGSSQFSIDAASNSVVNNGPEVGELQGSLSLQPEATFGGGVRTLFIWSEMSMDGVSWAPIDGSLRTIDLFGTLDSFATLSSRGAAFPAGARVRWQMYASNDMTIEAPDDQTTPNGVVGGFSVLWELAEVA